MSGQVFTTCDCKAGDLYELKLLTKILSEWSNISTNTQKYQPILKKTISVVKNTIWVFSVKSLATCALKLIESSTSSWSVARMKGPMRSRIPFRAAFWIKRIAIKRYFWKKKFFLFQFPFQGVGKKKVLNINPI